MDPTTNLRLLPDTQRQEKLSDAYLRAVVAYAGMSMAKPDPDFGKMDWLILPPDVYPSIGVQLKATYNYRETDTTFQYDLDVATYNWLRRYSPAAPAILAVLILPREPSSWIEQTSEELVMRKCMYRAFLGGHPASSNRRTTTISLQKQKMLSSEWLTEYFNTLVVGGTTDALL